MSHITYNQFQDIHHKEIANYEIAHMLELTNEFIIKIRDQAYKNNIQPELNDLLNLTNLFLYKIKSMKASMQ